MNAQTQSRWKTRTWWGGGVLLVLALGVGVWDRGDTLLPMVVRQPSGSINFVYLGQPNEALPSSAEPSDLVADHPFLGLGYDFDAALATQFAAQQGRKANFIARPTMAAVNAYLLKHPEAVGVGLPQVDNRQFINLPAYRQVTLMLVSKSRTPFPKSLTLPSTSPSALAEPPRTIAHLSTSPFADTLADLLRGYPQYKLLPIASDSMGVLIQAIQDDEADYALINRADWNLLSFTHPSWVAQLSIDESLSIGWRIAATAAEDWQMQLQEFFAASKKSERLLSLAEQFRPDFDRLDNLDLRYFAERRRSRLPALDAAFRQAAATTKLPVAMLMALSYQESQWDHTQVSPTGARGLMMINAPTAEFLRLPDDPNVAEQIMAGAKYFKILHDDLQAIGEPDRTLIALASYNIGPGAMSRLLTRMVSQYALYNPQDNLATLAIPLNLAAQKQPADGTLIRPSLSPKDWQKITWSRLRQFVLEQSLLGKVSSQPVILTERVRIFQTLLENSLAATTIESID